MEQTLAFGDLLEPIGEDIFFAEYYRRKPLHVRGGARRLSGLMDWPALNRLLGLSAHWTRHTLHLVLDRHSVAPEDYCREVPGPAGAVAQADPAKVQAWIDRGASIVLNSIDTLSPELQAVAAALEQALGGYVQANLYCSFAEHQALDSHFDTHDVFALHTEGEKVWRLYEGRINAPLNHPLLKEHDAEFHRRHRGNLAMEVKMMPGDLLYIPRGQYHDALAASTACIHLSFGMVSLRGLDLLHLLEKHCVADPLFRDDLPPPGDAGAGKALEDHLARLADRLGALLRDPETLADLVQAQRSHRGVRGSYALPLRRPSQTYHVMANHLRVLRQERGYVLKSNRQGVSLPPGAHRLVDWVLTKRRFTRAEIDAEFREIDGEERSALLDQLEAMRVIEKAGMVPAPAGAAQSAAPLARVGCR